MLATYCFEAYRGRQSHILATNAKHPADAVIIFNQYIQQEVEPGLDGLATRKNITRMKFAPLTTHQMEAEGWTPVYTNPSRHWLHCQGYGWKNPVVGCGQLHESGKCLGCPQDRAWRDMQELASRSDLPACHPMVGD